MPLLDRDDCTLVIIDVQSNFYPPKRLDVDRQRFHDMVRRIAWITQIADRQDIPVLVTEEDPAGSGHTVPEIREVLPAKAVTLPKNAFAVWDNPDIAAAIEATGRTTMVLVGIETDICVAHSAIQLHDVGKRVVVVDDAAYSPGPAHERGLRRLRGQRIETLSTKELFYDWARTIEYADTFHDTHADLSVPPGVRL
ncbi:isochorismatase family protein [Streptomyces sp. SID8366]|uniref:isochorismatase family protein n=1 Tax=unclassified Streptomyces TaxID=2593676 RepID=UPI000DB9FDFA|nr:isochorismatase family protein [Streptomyces sp. PsTaAH-130]MYU05999.1 isochorismatase family protein [Streptomyces sp. SID8366]MYU64354.1 isochorismatase family protein [Streptomyces sp. SID69]RAJ64058.1 nicotinamidase-related amidase [Streptomyces sp. PsTaAH-130]